jgi:hypothetical protein
MKSLFLLPTLIVFFLPSLQAVVGGPLDFTPPKGASVSFNGVGGIGMYSIDSADLGQTMMLTKIPGGAAMDQETLLKTKTDAFVTQMKAQEKLVGKLTLENPEVEDFKGESFSGKFVRFTLTSEALSSVNFTIFYLLSDGEDTWSATVTGDEGWSAECKKLLSSMKKK